MGIHVRAAGIIVITSFQTSCEIRFGLKFFLEQKNCNNISQNSANWKIIQRQVNFEDDSLMWRL